MTRSFPPSAHIPNINGCKIGVIGLGYVGLPLAVEFAQQFYTVGYDISKKRVRDIKNGTDITGEVDSEQIMSAHKLVVSDNPDSLQDCSVFIVSVPTPIDVNRQPNLHPLISASETIGQVLKRGDVVIYESTVYPGATEENCVPVLENVSGLRFNHDFYVGYSPERVNPGDKSRPLRSIRKITSGSTFEVAMFVDELYKRIILGGTHRAPSIKVAEAAKIIENTQRDVNIALINELSIIFFHLGIDTSDVLDAASSKWNFVRYSPGLVGGHCIGVDPYYLMHRSVAAGHVPDLIRIGREINDSMARESAGRLLRALSDAGHVISRARALILGVTFKENCPDTRNTKIFEFGHNLNTWGVDVDYIDSWADADNVREEYDVRLKSKPDGLYDAVVVAVPHDALIREGSSKLRTYLKPNGILFDLKSAFNREESDLRL